MDFIKLPIEWDATDPQLEELGIGVKKIEQGWIHVNPPAICAINDHSDKKMSVIRLSDGNAYNILMPEAELLNKLKDSKTYQLVLNENSSHSNS